MKNRIKQYENILIYDISYKTFMGSKPLRIRFDKIGGFIKIHDEIRYLVILDYEEYDKIYDRIRSEKSYKSSLTR